MENGLQKTKIKVPKIQDLYNNVELYEKHDELAYLLNQNPPEKWIKVHPYIKNYKYLPIDKIEYLLRQIFKDTSIEILREGTAFNGVYVVVRVHYRDIVTGEMKFNDGIGASELQTAKGKSVADLNSINPGAISMAMPIAEVVAIKDACDKFGRLFGSDLNRKDLVPVRLPVKEKNPDQERIEILINTAENQDELDFAKGHAGEEFIELIKLKQKELNLKNKS